MLLPVLVDPVPMTDSWVVGVPVAPRLTWCDAPALPDDVVLHNVPMRAEPVHGPGGQPWGQLLKAGGLTAARVGHVEAGQVTLSGCLRYDGYFQASPQVPTTRGVVRRIQVVQDLHDRDAERWIRRPGATRMIDAPDTSAERLGDDPSFTDPELDDTTSEPQSFVMLSPEQYLRRYGHLLPAEQWQARGFLVTLELV